MAAYIDPDIAMSKKDYLKQNVMIEDEIKAVNTKIEKAHAELVTAPTSVELETFERFTAEIRKRLKANEEPTPEQKRALFDILHLKVYIKPDGEVRLDGWFSPLPENENDGLMSKSCSWWAHPARARP